MDVTLIFSNVKVSPVKESGLSPKYKVPLANQRSFHLFVAEPKLYVISTLGMTFPPIVPPNAANVPIVELVAIISVVEIDPELNEVDRIPPATSN